MNPRRLILVLLPGLFFGLVIAARAWFWTAGPEAPNEFLRIQVKGNAPDWAFSPEPVGEVARGILATTNLFNGTFSASGGRRVTVFAAHWHAESSEAMSVVQHTPDLCWVGAGWKPIPVGQPDRVLIRIGEREVPFECRVFTPPNGVGRELVLWCTLVGGTVLEESSRWSIEEDSGARNRTRFDWASRRIAANQFIQNLSQRRRGVGEKQFVRFSTSDSDGWESALERLKSFAPAWLELDVRSSGSR